MYKHLIIALAMLSGFSGLTQDISTTVLSTSGGTGQIPAVQLEWTFGEAVISSFSNDQQLLTCGFHQGERFCMGDLNFDGFITNGDLLIFLSQYGCSNECIADFDNDGNVGSTDLLTFLLVYDSQCYGANN